MATKPAQGGLMETIRTVFWALVIAGLFRTLFFQPFWIPSESMKDTMLVGDFVFINKMAYGYSRFSCPFNACPITGRLFATEPERGDIVVFSHPQSSEILVKRLIGLPGERIQVRNGLLYINDILAPQTPAGQFEEVMEPQGSMANRPRCENGNVPQGQICTRTRSIETLPNGRQHNVLNIETDGYGDNTPVFEVPAGHYFFMGDNRDNSLDSRFPNGIGYVPAENLIGRADMVLFSSAGRSLFYVWTWRMDRFFTFLH
ncbi:MAG: signal peptidase I [Candidatus Saccharibacteria bacterium]|nr:signal peptidase I [Pseudorhodobacter sp.]